MRPTTSAAKKRYECRVTPVSHQLGRPAVDDRRARAPPTVSGSSRPDARMHGRQVWPLAAAGRAARARGSRSRAAPPAADRPARRPGPRRGRRRFGPRSRPPRRPRAGRCRSAPSDLEPELGSRDREHPRAAAEVEHRLRIEPLEQLERRPRRAVPARAERAPGVDHDAMSSPPAGGLSPLVGCGHHGGPIQMRPTVTGRWYSRQRSSQPGSTSSALEAGGGGALGVAREDHVVAVALLLEPAGEQVEHACERRLGLGSRHAHPVALHRNAVRSRWKNPSSAA